MRLHLVRLLATILSCPSSSTFSSPPIHTDRNMPSFKASDIPDLSGRVAIVTGGNAGLGA
jgi:hypothetical protein